MQTLTLKPLQSVHGEIYLPGSKSLSNRILLLAALAQGETRITNLLDSDDVGHMLEALGLLGVELQLTDNKRTCTVKGLGHTFNIAAPQTLYLGNAGTAVRPLTAVLAASVGKFTITGEPRMYERPIGDLVDALVQVGGDIHYQKDEGF